MIYPFGIFFRFIFKSFKQFYSFLFVNFLPGTGTFFSKNAVVSSLFDGISTRRIVQPFAERTDRHWMFYLSNKISSLARYFLPWTGTFFRMRPHPKSRMRESRTSGSVRGVPCERCVYSTRIGSF